jgi:hypothetical protein
MMRCRLLLLGQIMAVTLTQLAASTSSILGWGFPSIIEISVRKLKIRLISIIEGNPQTLPQIRIDDVEAEGCLNVTAIICPSLRASLYRYIMHVQAWIGNWHISLTKFYIFKNIWVRIFWGLGTNNTWSEAVC